MSLKVNNIKSAPTTPDDDGLGVMAVPERKKKTRALK